MVTATVADTRAPEHRDEGMLAESASGMYSAVASGYVAGGSALTTNSVAGGSVPANRTPMETDGVRGACKIRFAVIKAAADGGWLGG